MKEARMLTFGGRVKGKRAFELLLGLFRQGIGCEYSAREEGRNLRIGFSKNSLVWRLDEGQSPPNIVKHLLARSPVSASDLTQVFFFLQQLYGMLGQIRFSLFQFCHFQVFTKIRKNFVDLRYMRTRFLRAILLSGFQLFGYSRTTVTGQIGYWIRNTFPKRILKPFNA